MGKGFFVKLAAGNLKRNHRLYLPFWICTTIMAVLYFMMVSIMTSPKLTELQGGQAVRILFNLGYIIVTIFTVIFILYTASFLTKRRKREFGLYAILGMQKRHVAWTLTLENLMMFLSAIAIGIVAGLLFGKLLFLGLLKMMGVDTPMEFAPVPMAYIATAALFIGLFVVATLLCMVQIHLSNPIDLLKSEQKGEKKFRLSIPFSIVGLGLLGWAYYLASTVQSSITALTQFFVAVLMVILATYLLFIAGSYVFLKLLKRSKKIYYRPRNFVAISGLIHRMRQNAAGLASICILSTMVVVTVSGSTSLYFGQAEMNARMCPDDLTMMWTMQNDDGAAERSMEDTIRQTAAQYNVHIDEMNSFNAYYTYGIFENSELKSSMSDTDVSMTDDSQLAKLEKTSRTIYLMPASEYEKATGEQVSLQSDELLLASSKEDYNGSNTLKISDTIWKIQPVYNSPLGDGKHANREQVFFLVANDGDVETLKNILPPNRYAEMQTIITANYSGGDIEGFSQTVDQINGNNLDGIIEKTSEKFSIFINDYNAYSKSSAQMFGGLLIVGAFLTVTFLAATVLLIYFKQVSEGYEDKKRFEILKKVGMGEHEIRKTINKQISLVFFLPLIGALLHAAFCFHMLAVMLKGFGMISLTPTALCMLTTGVVFAATYFVIYKLTARVYYKIVQ